jgi:hypothetical protein
MVCYVVLSSGVDNTPPPSPQLSILKLNSLIHVPTYSIPPPSSAYLRAPSGSQEYKFQFAEHSRQNSIISFTPSATERLWCTVVTTQLLLIVLDILLLATHH